MSERRYTEKNLVEDFSHITGLSLEKSRTYVMMVFEIIKDKMESGEPVVISNFTKFQTTRLKETTKTLNGKQVKLKPQYTPSTVFSKGFRQEIHRCSPQIDRAIEAKKKEQQLEDF